jgi:hypothetical protein
MGHCGVLMLVLLASCTVPNPGQSNLLPPTQDAAAGVSPSRRPGDPQTFGAADSGAPAADVAAEIQPDAPRGAQGTDADTAGAPDTSPSQPDAPELAADASPREAGVTWDANLKTTDCGITKPWAAKTSYAKYDFALNYGHIFQCLGEPPYRLDCKSPDYEPGKPGGAWMEAWFDAGICR